MEYEKECSQINFIIENMEQSEKNKLPNQVKQFFFLHKDPFYKVNLDVNKNLYDQELLIETKAFLYIIKYKYLSTEKEKEELKHLLDIEKEKMDMDSTMEIPIVKDVKKEEKALTIIKENKIKEFFRNILEKVKKIINFDK